MKWRNWKNQSIYIRLRKIMSIELSTGKVSNMNHQHPERRRICGTKSLLKRILINKFKVKSKLKNKNYVSLLFLSLYRKGLHNLSNKGSYQSPSPSAFDKQNHKDIETAIKKTVSHSSSQEIQTCKETIPNLEVKVKYLEDKFP